MESIILILGIIGIFYLISDEIKKKKCAKRWPTLTRKMESFRNRGAVSLADKIFKLMKQGLKDERSARIADKYNRNFSRAESRVSDERLRESQLKDEIMYEIERRYR